MMLGRFLGCESAVPPAASAPAEAPSVRMNCRLDHGPMCRPSVPERFPDPRRLHLSDGGR